MKRKKSKIRLLANLVTIGGALLVTEMVSSQKEKVIVALICAVIGLINYADGHLEET